MPPFTTRRPGTASHDPPPPCRIRDRHRAGAAPRDRGASGRGQRPATGNGLRRLRLLGLAGEARPLQRELVGWDQQPRHDPAGTWYMLPVNPAASPAGQAECLKLPLYAWVLPGQLPPAPPIPPATLRMLALAKLTRPGIGNIDVNPAGRSYANLPTFVRVGLTGAFERTAGGRPYATVTASLPDGSLSVTVWAMAQPLSIDAGTLDASMYTGGCRYLGSTATAKQMSGTGANQPIDCGVTYRRPSDGYNLTTSISWRVYWAITTGDGDGPLPPQAGMSASARSRASTAADRASRRSLRPAGRAA